MAASRDQLQRLLSVEDADAIGRLLTELKNARMDGEQAAVTLRLLADSRKAQESVPKPQLVWSDLDVRGNRDTSVVAHELFRSAQRYVLVSTYNLGHKRREGEEPGHPLLRPLAERMAQLPKLRVRMFCNLKRMPWQMEANQEQVVADFARWFQAELWPWSRLPELYFDPRSLAPQKEDDAAKATACLHAKCILIDDEQAFVTSANLTTAAQSRNIEAGALLRDVSFAKSLRLQFEALINRNLVCRVPDVHWSQPAER